MPVPQTSSIKVDRSTKTLRELTLENMRGAIFSGHFKPGERLVERKLCEQLDVSRSVVREVLRHLETEGLVESVPHQGPVVASLDADRAAQIYELRALLEGHAARLCAEKASDATIQRLGELNDQIQAAFRDDDFHEVMVRTSAFYEAMFVGSGLTMAWDIVQSLNARINRLRAMTISSSGRKAEAAAEMARIVQALRQRDPQAAQEASEAHVRRVAEIAAQRLADAAR
ncbi:GntR family transcriptional regulator [Polaromonas sp. SM01]|uniref:GntR family transcriptional regulator n=1 Tax=Polaromonas sp. SM01 TaxID=3085630 RepID=UPI002980D945|nr:GntR family transcriptional regulator [Polaromonas sp. SM01]MDW5440963.1 GntR family transcriptional regulator [Polaromonas sp. SM01]